MHQKELIQRIGFIAKENTVGIFYKKYANANDYVMEVDFTQGKINYGELIICESKTTQNFSQGENWVVFECVNRLLDKGYKPKNIILEKTWPSGHGTSGRLDICVTDDDGSEYLLIECKTFGREFDKELARMKKDGGQLFTYFKFSNKANLLMLYASELNTDEIIFRNEIVKIEDEYRNGDVKDFHDRWSKLTKNNGVFDDWVSPYDFESKALTMGDLVDIKQEDSGFIFNQFLEILRHNTVSDKGNAFNRIFTLFLSKIYDEKINEGTKNQLGFQWLEGVDDHRSFQLRLTDLYKNGMYEFLEKNVTDFSESEFNNRFHQINENERSDILALIQKIRLEKNNEFAIKDVFDTTSFGENAVVVKEIVELLQGFKLRYTRKQQYLSDFFELLLTTGLKQESGQFFTPVPVAQFLIKSLPIDTILTKKLSDAKIDNDTLLPYVMDYAAGSGHFLTETMHEFQRLIDAQDDKLYATNIAKKLRQWKDDHFVWALQYIYGIEKDYRLVKVGKVGCYLHGDGLANVIHSDGLARFGHADYKGKLLSQDKEFPKDNKQFDIIVSNPPYSVSSFRGVARRYYSEEDFDLYEYLTDNSSEIECLFIERTKQLLKDGGVAGIILPSSILSNGGIYARARAMLLEYFDVLAIAELGSNTFMATGTNTATFFLRRRNNYVIKKIRNAVESFVTNCQDITINGIEKPISKYIAHVWFGLSFEDYVSLIKQTPSETLKSHDLYKEYRSQILAKKGVSADKIEKDFWQSVLSLETEKICYFILTATQQVVLVKSGKKNIEKRFLGYKFSNRRGDEGIHPFGSEKNIEDCTQLFDPHSFKNPAKASSYIYQAFHGDFTTPIDFTLRQHVSRTNLVDMLNFNRAIFDKSLSTAIKKKIATSFKYTQAKLGEVCEVLIGGTPSRKNNEYFGGNNLWVSISEMDGSMILDTKEKITDLGIKNSNVKLIPKGTTLLSFKLSIGKTALAGKDLYTNEAVAGLIPKDPNKLSNRYLYQLFNVKFVPLDRDGFNAFGKSLNSNYLKNEVIIPLAPPDIQVEIVNECQVVDDATVQAQIQIAKTKLDIDALFLEAKSQAQMEVRLSSNEDFEIMIGKRVLTKNVKTNGIPVFSANVFEPFGFVDKNLITDFTSATVLWGIDGDWMVNYMPPDQPFYPTDHCGVIRTKSNLVHPRYLAFALENVGKEQDFSRTHRASIDRISALTILIPSLEIQEKFAKQVEALFAKILDAQKIISEASKKKTEIIRSYLE
jgi:type I restriction enzyme M protein